VPVALAVACGARVALLVVARSLLIHFSPALTERLLLLLMLLNASPQ